MERDMECAMAIRKLLMRTRRALYAAVAWLRVEGVTLAHRRTARALARLFGSNLVGERFHSDQFNNIRTKVKPPDHAR
jgi:hypothetical protein